MRRRDLLKTVLPATAMAFLPGVAAGAAEPQTASDRGFWLAQMQRVAHPVLDALAHRSLKATMPVEAARGEEASRKHTTHLEAVGRLLSGIAPWLEDGAASGDEGALRAQYIAMVHEGLAGALDPRSPDALEFDANAQNLVDAAFLSLAVLRAPQVLNAQLDAGVRKRLAEALRATRKFTPGFNNWLLFAAAIEAALHAMGEPFDRMRVDYALREHASWYVGDGVYGDGPRFHADYYDSFVIHPFLLAVLDELSGESAAWQAMVTTEQDRAARFAHTQERMIAGDGTWPVMGRSITYRCGAFHALADVALRRALPDDLSPEQVRCALAATMRRSLDAAGTFDANGWLRIGLAGHQPSLGERYISTGSLYLCGNVFLPLGLDAGDRFWSAPDAAWTAQKVWSGQDLAADHAIEN
ncbi:MAG: DUF2264 domain-containing protein [Acidobacteriota bacterium]